MIRQNYILKIDNPCRQDWNSMTTNDVGKFCSHCSKTVTDFTGLTDKEIVKIIENSSGRICGRLANQQLNRILNESKSRNSFSQIYKLLSGLLLFGTVENSFATDKITKTEIIRNIENNESSLETENIIQPTDSLKNIVQGKVIDAQTKEPIPFAQLVIKNSKTGVVTDINGDFKLTIPDSLLTEKIILTLMYIGYEKIEVTIDKRALPITKDYLIIPAENVLLGDVVITKKRRWWQRKTK